MANWAQVPLALGPGPISVLDSKRSIACLCLCILPMRWSLFNGQLGPGASGPNPISVLDSKRSTAYLCLCILPMKRSLFNGQLGPGALGLGPRAHFRPRL